MALSTNTMKIKQPQLMSRRFGDQPLVDVANRVSTRTDVCMGTPDTAMKPTNPSRRPVRRPALHSKGGGAVPFPTICEEGSEKETAQSQIGYVQDATTEEIRGHEWAQEIARRRENIKELRDRKIRLEQSQASRTRKSSPSHSYMTSTERKLSADDVDFIAALHASVVWRLWHVNLTPDVFASERLLATRLHLVLMRHGRQNIPVPPIVALSRSHHLMQTFSNRHMMEKDRPGIQTLPQLVAKSLLRQRKPRRSLSRSNVRLAMKMDDHPTSPLSGEPLSLA